MPDAREQRISWHRCLLKWQGGRGGPDKLSDGSDRGMEGSAAHAGAVCHRHRSVQHPEALNECDFPLAQASPRSDQTTSRVCVVYSRHGCTYNPILQIERDGPPQHSQGLESCIVVTSRGYVLPSALFVCVGLVGRNDS
jgi:hypothetical protein